MSDKNLSLGEDWESFQRRANFARNKNNPLIGQTRIEYQILKEGAGEKAGLSSAAIVHYITCVKGEWSVMDSTIGKDPFEFEVGGKGIVVGFSASVADMKKGEKRIVSLPSAYAYGEGGGGKGLDKDAVLIFEIELIDFSPCGTTDPPEGSGEKRKKPDWNKIF